jgi:hypothetical protein
MSGSYAYKKPEHFLQNEPNHKSKLQNQTTKTNYNNIPQWGRKPDSATPRTGSPDPATAGYQIAPHDKPPS